MANVATTNPMVLDTAAAVLTGPTHVKQIRVIYSADDDDVEITDKNGNSVFLSKAGTIASAGRSETVNYPGGIKMDGLTVATIDGTTKVYVYLK